MIAYLGYREVGVYCSLFYLDLNDAGRIIFDTSGLNTAVKLAAKYNLTGLFARSLPSNFQRVILTQKIGLKF